MAGYIRTGEKGLRAECAVLAQDGWTALMVAALKGDVEVQRGAICVVRWSVFLSACVCVGWAEAGREGLLLLWNENGGQPGVDCGYGSVWQRCWRRRLTWTSRARRCCVVVGSGWERVGGESGCDSEAEGMRVVDDRERGRQK